MHKLKNIYIGLFLLVCTLLKAQTNKNIVYGGIGMTYSKLNIDNFETLSLLDYYWKLAYQTRKPVLGVLGYDMSIHYQRQINEKLSVGLGLNLSRVGQESRLMYGVKTDNRPPPENYGGAKYTLQFRSFEIPLTCYYYFKHHGTNRFFFEGTLIYDIFLDFEFQDYIVTKKDGKISIGSYTLTGASYTNFSNLVNRIKHHSADMVRLGLSTSIGYEYVLSEHTALALKLYSKYLSDSLKNLPPRSLAHLSGDFFAFGIELNIITKF